MYDIAIVGAGINGSSVAYEFLKQNKKVILFDQDTIASGGSGAAGAFISPKFATSGELKDLLDEQGSLGWEAVHLEMERTEHLGKPCRSYRIVLKARYK